MEENIKNQEYEVSSRSKKTELAYVKRASWLEDVAAMTLGLVVASPNDVCDYLIGIKPKISRSTWRQYKSSLIYYFNSAGTKESVEAAEMLKTEGQEECLKKSSRTSGRRKKNITNEEFSWLILTIRRHIGKRKYSEDLIKWLIVGSITGLRPHEWKYAQVVHAFNESKANQVLLKVQNAKNTNNRSHGEYRHIDISNCDKTIILAIDEFCKFMRDIQDNGLYDRLYYCCAYYLRVANKKAFGKNCKWLQLYSPRHKFASESKLSFSQEEVAALMGHATDRTASIHYGRRSFGSGGSMVKPISDEVKKIRKTNSFHSGSEKKSPVLKINSKLQKK